MTYVVTKYIKGNPYLYEVKSVREGDRVRQVFVRYLGRADKPGREYSETEPVEREVRERPAVAAVSEAVAPTVAVEAETPAPIKTIPIEKITPPVTPTPVIKEPWQMTKAEYTEAQIQKSRTLIETWNKAGSKGIPPTAAPSIYEIAPMAEKAGYIMPRDAEKVLKIPYHQLQVEASLKQGLPVPPEVLKDYPELTPKPAGGTVGEQPKYLTGEALERHRKDFMAKSRKITAHKETVIDKVDNWASANPAPDLWYHGGLGDIDDLEHGYFTKDIKLAVQYATSAGDKGKVYVVSGTEGLEYAEPGTIEGEAGHMRIVGKIQPIKTFDVWEGFEREPKHTEPVEEVPITPINPYMNMPIERVRRDAQHGVKLAKEALATREEEIPEVIPVTTEVTKPISEKEAGWGATFDITHFAPSEIREVEGLKDAFVYVQRDKTFVDFGKSVKTSSAIEQLDTIAPSEPVTPTAPIAEPTISEPIVKELEIKEPTASVTPEVIPEAEKPYKPPEMLSYGLPIKRAIELGEDPQYPRMAAAVFHFDELTPDEQNAVIAGKKQELVDALQERKVIYQGAREFGKSNKEMGIKPSLNPYPRRKKDNASTIERLQKQIQMFSEKIKHSVPTETTPSIQELQYSRDLDIRNIEALPKGTGAKYLITLKGQGDELIAKQWARVKPASLKPDEVLVSMTPPVAEGKRILAEAITLKPETPTVSIPETPMVSWFHGTHSDIQELAPRDIQQVKSLDTIGTWVTGSPEKARMLYGANVFKVKAQPSNLLEAHTDTFEDFFYSNKNLFKEMFPDKDISLLEQFKTKGLPATNKELAQMRTQYLQGFRKMIEDAGYDGIIWKNSRIDLAKTDTPHDVAVLFNKQSLDLSPLER